MTDTAARWQNRVVAYKRMRIGDLQANPHNWRLHPDVQRQTVSGLLAEVGQVYPVLYNQRTGRLIDGHLRRELDPEAEWDVAIVDLDEGEEALVLATLDPVAALAEMNPEAFAALQQQLSVESPAIQTLLHQMSHEAGLDLTPYADVAPPEPEDPEADDFGPVRVEAGDLWLIPSQSVPGKVHRLVCGDSTDPVVVARLMQGERAVLFATDPPYLVDTTPPTIPTPGTPPMATRTGARPITTGMTPPRAKGSTTDLSRRPFRRPSPRTQPGTVGTPAAAKPCWRPYGNGMGRSYTSSLSG